MIERKAREMLSQMQKYKPKDFRSLYPGASHLAIDLLTSMLQFDPDKRISVEDALNHPYFHDIFLGLSFEDNVQPMSDEIEK